MGSVFALFLHGIGSPGSGYSSFAQRTLAASCSRRGATLYGREVLYAPLFDMAANRFLEDTKSHGSSGGASQKLSIKTLADALQFQGNAELRKKICHVVDYEYLQLRAPEEVVIFAHSLGNMIALEWLRSRTAVKKVTLVSMACNVGIFTLGQPLDIPSQLKEPGKWLNVWDKDDALGWPMAVVPEAKPYVIDVQTNIGGFLSWTGLVHTHYWEDKALWKDTVPNLLAI